MRSRVGSATARKALNRASMALFPRLQLPFAGSHSKLII
jgi:hypothetical protein